MILKIVNHNSDGTISHSFKVIVLFIKVHYAKEEEDRQSLRKPFLNIKEK